MSRAVVDTSVLFAATYRRDAAHSDGLPVLRGIDDGSLPEAVVLDYVLGETLNGLTTHAGHDAAVDFLDRVEENARFHIATLQSDELAAAKSLFRRYEGFSFVDACIVAYMQSSGIECIYAFDDDFDRIDELFRLETATNPFGPH
ncbi:type II toxin-antitoxin system VapC family toxin [Natrinema gelatinilyticum]|uniref:type II toxin-antitoxin system VapC family toxin n=1 Tax=Natrinema gelatinilyticum TaxID=2961571 RepID=UPI0020C5641F|nr:PIN domain-containing protein [Natrinema gelatinilyticum]